MVYTKAFDQVLDGKFICTPDCDPMAQHLLWELARPQEVAWIPDCQLEEVTLGWKKAREATSSSSSSVHSLGHYMVGTFNPTIAIFNARLADIGMSSGYSLKRWHTGLNIMLQKQVGNLNVDKLQIILFSRWTTIKITNGLAEQLCAKLSN